MCADTSYAGCAPTDVAVVEPPHRGDRDTSLDAEPELMLHRLIARFYALPGARQRIALEAFKSALDNLRDGDESLRRA